MKPLITFILLTITFFVNAQDQNSKDSVFNWLTFDRARYSIQYPTTWRIDTSKQFGADLFLFSQKESDTDNFSENVNVMIEDLTGLNINLDKYIEINEGQIKNLVNDVSIIESNRVSQTNKEFHKLIFTGTQGIFSLKTEQYYFIIDEKAFVVTLSTEKNRFEKYKKMGETILESFTIKR